MQTQAASTGRARRGIGARASGEAGAAVVMQCPEGGSAFIRSSRPMGLSRLDMVSVRQRELSAWCRQFRPGYSAMQDNPAVLFAVSARHAVST